MQLFHKRMLYTPRADKCEDVDGVINETCEKKSADIDPCSAVVSIHGFDEELSDIERVASMG